MPDSALPPNLRGKNHWDWPTFFTILWRGKKIEIGLKWIPRGWTAFKWGPPLLLWGNGNVCGLFECGSEQGKPGIEFVKAFCSPKPINQEGSWQISYFPYAPWWAKPFAWYVSFSGKHNPKDGKFSNVRAGARWDDVDDYVNCTFIPLPSRRRYTGAPDQDTSTGHMKA
jgi:hypothetical protein